MVMVWLSQVKQLTRILRQSCVLNNARRVKQKGKTWRDLQIIGLTGELYQVPAQCTTQSNLSNQLFDVGLARELLGKCFLFAVDGWTVFIH